MVNPIVKQIIELATSLISRDAADSLIKQAEAVYNRLQAQIRLKDEFGMDPVLIKMLRPIFKFLYKDWWRVETEGIKNIPAAGKAIIVANHSGMLPYDAVMLNMAVYDKHPKKRNVRFLIADFVENFPVLSEIIQRGGGVKGSPENAERLLKRKELICVFPEGVKGIGKLYCDKYKLQMFGKGGVIRLALKTGAPIIPCAIIGAEEIHPILWKLEGLGKKLGLPFIPITPTFPLLGLLGLVPFPCDWKIIFDKPFSLPKKAKEADIMRLNNNLRAHIQKMIDSNVSSSRC